MISDPIMQPEDRHFCLVGAVRKPAEPALGGAEPIEQMGRDRLEPRKDTAR